MTIDFPRNMGQTYTCLTSHKSYMHYKLELRECHEQLNNMKSEMKPIEKNTDNCEWFRGVATTINFVYESIT